MFHPCRKPLIRHFGNDAMQVFCFCQTGVRGMRVRRYQEPLHEVNNDDPGALDLLVEAWRRHARGAHT